MKIRSRTLMATAIAAIFGFLAGPAPAGEEVVSISEVFVHNEGENYGGKPGDMIVGTGMNGNAFDQYAPPVSWSWPTNSPSLWTDTGGPHYADEWQSKGLLNSGSSANSKIGWAIFDLGSEVTGLQNLYTWNIRQASSKRTVTGNIYYSTTPTVAPSHPASGSVDYDFASGGWTQVGGTETFNAPGSAPISASNTNALGGVAARYIAIEMLTNNGDGNGVGFAEVGISRDSAPSFVVSDLSISNVTQQSATFHSSLLVDRTNAEVSVYWNTSDGGTNTANWTNSAYVGSWSSTSSETVAVSFTTNILTSGTIYYYTFRGTNSSEVKWVEPSGSFSTLAAGEWSGAVDDKWGTAGNWSDGNVPDTAGEPATLGGFGAGDVDLNGSSYTVQDITISGGDYDFVDTNASPGSLTAGSLAHSAGDNTLSVGASLSGDLSVSGGTLTLADTGNFSANAAELSGGTLGVQGSIVPVVGTLTWDFESGDLTGWTVVPTTHGSGDIFNNGYQPYSSGAQQGTWSVRTYYRQGGGNSDSYTGIIETDSFVIDSAGSITFYISAGNHAFSGDPDSPNADMACVNLEREVAPGDWEMIESATGQNNWNWTLKTWDTTPYVGDTVRIRVYDTKQNSWGHTAVDNITATSAKVLGYGATDLTNLPVTVSGSATINVLSDTSSAMGAVTVTNNATLTVSGSATGVTFKDATIAPGSTAAGLDIGVDTTLTDTSGLEGSSASATITKSGSAALILDKAASNVPAGAKFDVTAGTLAGVIPAAFGSAVLELSGGTLALSSSGGNQVYDKALSVDANSTLTAGQHGGGVSGPVTVSLGSVGNDITVSSGTLSVGATDSYTLELRGNQSGNMNVTEGSISLATTSTNLGSVTLSGGTLTANNDLTAGSLIGAGGSFTMSGSYDLTVANAMTVGANLDFSSANLNVSNAVVTVSSGATLTDDVPLVADSWLIAGSVSAPGAITAETKFSFEPTVTINNQLTGNAYLHAGDNDNNNGYVALTAANTYGGRTEIERAVLRADIGQGIPATSRIVFNQNNRDQTAILETSGTFARNIGTSAGEVYWQNSGGFSAYGGDLTVTLEGGSELTWSSGTDGFNNRDAIQFGSTDANSLVELTNPIDLGNSDRRVQVFDNDSLKTDIARLSGDIQGTGANSDRHFRFNDSSGNGADSGLIELTGSNTYPHRTVLDNMNVYAIDGQGLPSISCLRLSGGDDNREAVLISTGTIARAIGQSAGEIYWEDRGGFAARGGPLAITLEGGAMIDWSDGNSGLNGRVLQLNSIYADDVVEITNDIELDDQRYVNVFDNTDTDQDVAKLSGDISQSGNRTLRKRKDGTLWLTGANTFTERMHIDDGAVRAVDGVGLPSNTRLYLEGDSDQRPAVFESNGTFTRDIANSDGNNVYWADRGGFAAWGAPLTVNLESGATLLWGDGNVGFSGRKLQLGSRTANDVVTMANDVDGQNNNREMYVFDNAYSTGDYSRATGEWTGFNQLRIRGDGLFVVENKLWTRQDNNSDWIGLNDDATLKIAAGASLVCGKLADWPNGMQEVYLWDRSSLIVNGTATGAVLEVQSNTGNTKQLGGSGSLWMRQKVDVGGGGVLTPGDDGVGTLNVTLHDSDRHFKMRSGAIYEWELGGTDNDKVEITGDLRLENGWKLKLVSAGGAPLPGTEYTLFTYTQDYDEGTFYQPTLDTGEMPADWQTDTLSIVHDETSTPKRVYLTGLYSTLSVANQPVSDVGGATATANGVLSCEGTILHARVYWSTNDWGTVATDWETYGASTHVGAFTNEIGEALSQSIGGLSTGTEYYYTFRATNTAATINLWATPAASFITQGTPAATTGGGATDIAIGAATLRGELTNGVTATAVICWGAADGGTGSTGAWDHAVSVGSVDQDAPFSVAISNAFFGVEYSYRVYVSNDVDTAWSDLATFSTLALEGGANYPTDGLIGMWTFDDGTAADVSGNGHDGTDHNSPTYAADTPAGSGLSVDFNGGDKGILIGGDENDFDVDTITIAAWVKEIPDGGWEPYIAKRGEDNKGYQLRRRGGDPRVTFTIRGTTGDDDPSPAATEVINDNPGTWYHLVARYDGVRRQLILDGNTASLASDIADTGTIPDATEALSFGNKRNGSNWDGSWSQTKLDDVYIYDRAITDEEVAQIFAIPGTAGVGEGIGVSNTVATGVTDTTANLAGVLDGTGSVFTVVAYCSTNENADAAAWEADTSALTATVGTYTNISGVAVTGAVSGLTADTTYYYSLVASNAVTNLWATPNVSFTSDVPPVVSALSPTNNATGVLPGADLVATFNESIALVPGGVITVTNLTDNTATTITLSDGQVTVVDGTNLTINLSSDLTAGKTYAVLIDGNAVTDTAGSTFAGISDTATWTFAVAAADAVAPQVSSLNPADSSTGVPIVQTLVATFDENIQLIAGGVVEVTNITAGSVTSITLPDAQVTVANDELQIDLDSNLEPSSIYAVLIDGDAVEDAWGNNFTGMLDTNAWSFTTDASVILALSSLSPTNGATAAPMNTELAATFDNNIATNTGNVIISNLTDSTAITIPMGDAQIAAAGAVLTITPASYLTPGATYAVMLDSGAVESLTGTPYGGIADTNTWQFTVGTPTPVSAGIVEAFGHNEKENYGGKIDDMIIGSGMNGYGNDGNPGWPSGEGLPSTWTVTGNAYQQEFVSGDLLDDEGPSNGKIGWVVFDIGSVFALDSLYLWNARNSGDGWTASFNVYVAETPTVAVPHGPTGGTSTDYDFHLGAGWTKINGAALTGARNGNQVVSLSGNSGQYVAVEMLTNGGSGDRVGFAEVGITVFDLIAPSITTLNPTNNATGVAGDASFVATFSEDVVANTGNVVVSNLTDATSIVIPVGDAQIAISGSTLTIDPTVYLNLGDTYAVLMDAGVVKDGAGNTFAGLGDTSTWRFTTVAPGAVAVPVVSVTGHNNKDNYGGNMSDLITGAGMNSYGDDGNVGWPAGEGSPSTWRATSASYKAEWQSGAILNAGTYGKVGWVSFDLGSTISGLADLYIWQLRENDARRVVTYNVYHATSPTVAPPSAPTDSSAVNYDFSSGGWTLVNSGGALTLPDNGGSPDPASAVVSLGGASARYVAIELLTNNGDGTKVGLAEIGITATDAMRPSVSTLSPTNGSVDVLLDVPLVATFNETIATNTGNVIISNLTAASSQTIAMGDAQISAAGAALTVTLSADLDADTTYAVLIDPGAVLDAAGNGFTGITATNVWSFHTVAGDFVAPTISTLSPVDDATDVLVGADLVATFSESLQVGTGNVTITNLTDSTSSVIAIGDAQVSVSGSNLTINPSTDLESGDTYAVLIDAGAVEDLAANDFTGISDVGTWQFVVDALPTLSSVSPTNNAVGVSPVGSLVATFSENMSVGSGNVVVSNLTESTAVTIPIADAQITLSGNTLTIDPAADLDFGDTYAVLIDAGAIEDGTGNAYAGIANTSTWRFTVTTDANWSLVAYWPLTNSTIGTIANGATVATQPGLDDVIDSADHPATNAVAEGGGNTWVNDAERGIVLNTVQGSRLSAGNLGIVLGEPFTWSVWVKSSVAGDDTIMGGRDGGIKMTVGKVSGSGWDMNGYNVADGAWNHLVLRYDGSKAQVYTNGVFFKEDSSLGSVGTKQLQLGGKNQYSEDLIGLMTDAAIWREALSVTRIQELSAGGAVMVDLAAPTISSLSPTNAATEVVVGANLVATFNETIVTNSGNIVVTNLTDATGNVIPIDDAQVSVSGTVLTINPTVDLDPNDSYAVLIDAGALVDEAGNDFGGIADTNVWSFETASVDLTAPGIASLSPVDDATAVSIGADLVATFDEPIVVGSGSIVVSNLTQSSGTVIPVGDTQVSVSGNTLTIDLTTDLELGNTYAVLIDAGAVTDLSANDYTGIGDTTTWRFTTDWASITGLSPTNGSTGVAGDAQFVVTYNGNIAAGSGSVTVSNLSDATSIVIPIGDAQISISGSVLTIDPSPFLDLGDTYAILIESGAVEDAVGNPLSGISDSASWQVVTELATALPVGINAVFGHNEGDNYGGKIDDMIIGSGMNGYGDDGNAGWPAGEGAPSTWAATGNAYQQEWVSLDLLDDETPSNGKIGWTVFDIGAATAVVDLYLWNVRNGSDSYTASFNVYVAEAPSVAVPHGPGGNGSSTDYDFHLGGGWTKVNGAPLTGARNGSQVVSLSGNTARYVALELLSNGGSGDRVGFAEVAITSMDTVRPTVVALNPANNTLEVDPEADLVVTFDEDVVANSGNVTVRNVTAATSLVIPIGDPQISISGNTLTINPSAKLAWENVHAVLIDPGAITDTAGNGFAGITDTVTWRFTTPNSPGTVFRFR